MQSPDGKVAPESRRTRVKKFENFDKKNEQKNGKLELEKSKQIF